MNVRLKHIYTIFSSCVFKSPFSIRSSLSSGSSFHPALMHPQHKKLEKFHIRSSTLLVLTSALRFPDGRKLWRMDIGKYPFSEKTRTLIQRAAFPNSLRASQWFSTAALDRSRVGEGLSPGTWERLWLPAKRRLICHLLAFALLFIFLSNARISNCRNKKHFERISNIE